MLVIDSALSALPLEACHIFIKSKSVTREISFSLFLFIYIFIFSTSLVLFYQLLEFIVDS